jgi:hypothetical protein
MVTRLYSVSLFKLKGLINVYFNKCFVFCFQLMKQMSSTDTPLGTLGLLQQKQKETQSPFVVLSGSKQT